MDVACIRMCYLHLSACFLPVTTSISSFPLVTILFSMWCILYIVWAHPRVFPSFNINFGHSLSTLVSLSLCSIRFPCLSGFPCSEIGYCVRRGRNTQRVEAKSFPQPLRLFPTHTARSRASARAAQSSTTVTRYDGIMHSRRERER